MVALTQKHAHAVNNAFYDELGDRWYTAQDDPVALLRAEAHHRNPWIEARIAETFGGRACGVLDVGCGAGFLANDLAAAGHRVVGLDTSVESLMVAATHIRSGMVLYQQADAMALPYRDGQFDVVCAMDFLEHVDDPARVVAEAARVLVPGGLFFFHTFNRNWLSWLVVIKGVEWFVRNTPPDLHVLDHFIKPDEMVQMCEAADLERVELQGSRPRLGAPFWKMLATRVVPDDFRFTFTRSTTLAYTGVARKKGPLS
jgi:2-polyprenyl-6-hydroxyphenyl methylase/3-demethylubiquinone-9 3-methyltransferase